MTFVTLGIITISLAYKYGEAGPNEAIKSNCTVVQTVITGLVTNTMPTGMQIGGLVAGMVSVLLIVCQNKQKVSKAKDKVQDDTIEK